MNQSVSQNTFFLYTYRYILSHNDLTVNQHLIIHDMSKCRPSLCSVLIISYLAGSHFGIFVHVPLLHTTGVKLFRNSYCGAHSTFNCSPCCTTVDEAAVSFSDTRIILPCETCGTTQGAANCK